MRPIATDTHDFQMLRGSGCIYVDKTMYEHRLLTTTGSNLFFISRPRRFGKSLTVSAFKADTRPVWPIGLSFDSKMRRLVDFVAEELSVES